jgi:hypothetical protein
MRPENATIASVIFAAFIVFAIFIIYKAFRLPKEKREGPIIRAVRAPATTHTRLIALLVGLLLGGGSLVFFRWNGASLSDILDNLWGIVVAIGFIAYSLGAEGFVKGFFGVGRQSRPSDETSSEPDDAETKK